MPRSPRMMIIVGLLGLLFFWFTDPQWGIAATLIGDRVRDAANAAMPGTIVGLVGSALVLLIGAWLTFRRVT